MEVYKITAGSEGVEKTKKLRRMEYTSAFRAEDFIAECDSVEEAWIRCAAHSQLDDLDVPTNKTMTKHIYDLRAQGYDRLKEDFAIILRQSEWLKHNNADMECAQYINLKKHVSEGYFGDFEVQKDMQAMMRFAECSYDPRDKESMFRDPQDFDAHIKAADAKAKATGKKVSNKEKNKDLLSLAQLEPQGKPRDEQLRKATKSLGQIAAALVSSKRSMRLFDTVQQIEAHAAASKSNRTTLTCACCGRAVSDLHKFSVLIDCGHLFCKKCLGSMDGQCGSAACQARYNSHEIFCASSFGVAGKKSKTKRFGAKIEKLIKLIKSIPKEEQVLLFVQFDPLRKAIKMAFNESNITFAELRTDSKAASVLNGFQEADVADQDQVLMLDIGGESAAGA